MSGYVQGAAALYSLADSMKKYNQARKDEYLLQNTHSPTYSANQSILDFYQKALQKYNTNPTDSAMYKLQDQRIKQGTVQGLNALKDRRLGGNVSSLINNQNNALLKAAAEGEKRKDQEFSVLGHATGMKAAEDSKAFQINSLNPFQQKYNLLAMKAAGEAQAGNAAMQNFYSNASAVEQSNSGDGSGKNSNWLNSIFGSKKKKSNDVPVESDSVNSMNDMYNYKFKNYGSPTGLNY